MTSNQWRIGDLGRIIGLATKVQFGFMLLAVRRILPELDPEPPATGQNTIMDS